MGLRRSWGNPNEELINPEVAGKEILLTGDIDKTANPTTVSGMIATQGNNLNGYALYLLDNKLYFRVNQAGKEYVIASKEVPGKFAYKAGIQKDGTMRLAIDQKEVGSAKAAGLFKADLESPVRVGQDHLKGAARLTNYPDSVFNLRARMENIKLETLDGTKVVVAETGKVDKVIVLKVVKDVMKYDKQLLTAKAGTTIQIVFENPDFMQHNLLLIKPNTLNKVGAAADKLAQEPNGAKMNYVPKMPEVLKATPLVNPGGKYTLTITLPDVPGDYPYVCTFPGHWRLMNGILRVTK
jgi:azurin